MMQVYLVGGAVRDKLLGLPIKERDWLVVGARAQTLIDQGYRQVGRDFPVFLHPQTQEEYALARTERKSGKGHHGFIVHSTPDVTLEEDLQRRDLTINAIAEDAKQQLIDPYGGLTDLKQGRLRHISPAFAEDPLRVFRVARFAARFHNLGFFIADQTLALMMQLCADDELNYLSKERIWKETEKVLASDHPHVYFEVLQQVGALRFISDFFKTHKLPDRLSKIDALQDEDTRYIAFCLLCIEDADKPDVQLQQLQAHFFVRQGLQDLCALIVRHNLLKLNTQPLNAEQIYLLIQQLDGIRRPERLLELETHLDRLHQIFDHIHISSFKFLTTCGQQIISLKLNTDDIQTLTGKAIGEALEKLRIKKIKTLISLQKD